MQLICFFFSMPHKNLIIAAIVLSATLGLSAPAAAHQPRIATGNLITVTDPAVSKAYYGQFAGPSVQGNQPVVYRIEATNAFPLYVNVLVPDIAGQKKNVTAVITKDGDIAHPVAVLDGFKTDWKPYFEPFGHDQYFQGEEYRGEAGPGVYEIRVTAPYSVGKYVLAIGEAESFTPAEIANALTLIPTLKREFFGESPATFVLSPWGMGYLAVMLLGAFLLGWIGRWLFGRYVQPSVRQRACNLGVADRAVRSLLAVLLFVWAIATTWNPIVLFLGGFFVFEAVFSWCVLYAATGRDTCRPAISGDETMSESH